ncbi:hypothetical protein F4553_007643 [Allocatelliglobosispora scoriae]|uniref:Abortive infection protein n=1 Tax=Allocatelliglobosispora scoriae TaxID=643052 RepID=A0A841C4H9_9ACTN|nr:hypothetical protein [Allocatelliglobosispora scoriae]MBB5874209.1 hypothetical protein [Allocatelliglobosispora scoriae]
MRAKGITYDTGFIPTGRTGLSTHEPFDPAIVEREMRIIRDDLHCAAVRITGGDPERLELTAGFAADAGLEVWFSPFTCDLTTDDLLDLLADCADRAERLRRRGAEVVFVTGGELTLCTIGFLPGATIHDRLALLQQPHLVREAMAGVPARLNDFLGRAVRVVRDRFGGPVTYAALPTERVDWTPFDFVAADAYRSIEVADGYADAIRTLVAQGKPVAVTEFGCTTHAGAADLGGRGGFMVEWLSVSEGRLVAPYLRDETEQVGYLRELLEIFTAEGVDTAFWCTFSCHHLPHRADPAEDLDLASYGVVKVLEGRTGEAYPGMPWEPKAAFAAMAEAYRTA